MIGSRTTGHILGNALLRDSAQTILPARHPGYTGHTACMCGCDPVVVQEQNYSKFDPAQERNDATRDTVEMRQIQETHRTAAGIIQQAFYSKLLKIFSCCIYLFMYVRTYICMYVSVCMYMIMHVGT